ncbi:hypothetical protein EAF04_008211 [Stromatinia cepivora]|nr:hypothetical protein EAF04_008211 [Stromatinia cepivora]
MAKSLELEESFKKSCANFDQTALKLNKQMEQTQEELQKHKEKNDGHITELEQIQERLRDIRKKFRETAAEHKDYCGLVDSGSADEDDDKIVVGVDGDKGDEDGKVKEP